MHKSQEHISRNTIIVGACLSLLAIVLAIAEFATTGWSVATMHILVPACLVPAFVFGIILMALGFRGRKQDSGHSFS